MELLIFAELRDFPLGLAHSGGAGKRLGDRLALHFVGKAEVGTVARLVRLMTAAIGFATAARGGGDGTTAQIAESGDLNRSSGLDVV